MSAADLENLGELALLARLSLSEEELLGLRPELERILAAFEVLARHGPTAADAPSDESAPSGPAREDEPLPSLARELLLASAPVQADGFFVVPKTIGSAG